ncbi:MAG TPA: hypothetical protein VNG12_21805, partial [Acidimicrobiales bacterium]|nr:hypothetical protein [Acidimicrobiales bacterium]
DPALLSKFVTSGFRQPPAGLVHREAWHAHGSSFPQSCLGRQSTDIGGIRPEERRWRDAVRMLVIDVANVIGSRPTGWWRDRPRATRRFTERVRATVAVGRLEPPVTLVLEGQARAGADEADVDGVEIVHAPGKGDETIAQIAEAHDKVIVVTADRELAERVRMVNAEVVTPTWLLDELLD